MNNKHIVYLKIFSNCKIYVGITNDFKKRMYQHDYLAFKLKSKRPLYNAMRKYEHETQIIIECSSREVVCEYEMLVIKNFKELGYELYNMTEGGDGTVGFKYKMSDEHKKKISIATKGRVLTKSQKEGLIKSRKGIPLSEEHKAKLKRNIGMKGKKHKKESLDKMSKSKKNMYIGDKNPNYGKVTSKSVKEKISIAVKNANNLKYDFIYYANNFIKRGIFKRSCMRHCWDYDDFLEVDLRIIKTYSSGRKEKHYLYT